MFDTLEENGEEQLTALSTWGSYNTKIRRAAEGSWGSTEILVQRKQRRAVSDNAYNCPIIAVSEFCL